eukprot:1238867-Pleurochrysis_carterae.AAC.2
MKFYSKFSFQETGVRTGFMASNDPRSVEAHGLMLKNGNTCNIISLLTSTIARLSFVGHKLSKCSNYFLRAVPASSHLPGSCGLPSPLTPYDGVYVESAKQKHVVYRQATQADPIRRVQKPHMCNCDSLQMWKSKSLLKKSIRGHATKEEHKSVHTVRSERLKYSARAPVRPVTLISRLGLGEAGWRQVERELHSGKLCASAGSFTQESCGNRASGASRTQCSCNCAGVCASVDNGPREIA